MRAGLGVAAAIVVAAAGYAAVRACEPRGGGLTKTQADEMLQAHNGWRAKVGTRPLAWSEGLAALAQARAERLAAGGCRIEHGPLPEDVGENLFLAQPLRLAGHASEVLPLDPAQVVGAWGAEQADYDEAANRCAPGRECGHYTQLVWSATREVGCGMAVCASRGQVWVCDYQPGGNVSSQRAY